MEILEKHDYNLNNQQNKTSKRNLKIKYKFTCNHCGTVYTINKFELEDCIDRGRGYLLTCPNCHYQEIYEDRFLTRLFHRTFN